MLDSQIEMDESLESILQRPLTCFEKQQIKAKPQAPSDESFDCEEDAADTHPLRRRLRDMALMQVVHVDYPPQESRKTLIEIPLGAKTA
ncbi:hypothetical protein [Chromobacterium alticapitis]|uniref:Uncharacterized protein n=1 Tax=Chromobacterium alticapitis TaxID=2073169 RepID=A0A2S5DH99_9NEIS|nr:hypothetical protein [Chromobacterium alticapitis]POZ62414.1 hypothetical protein C2I19_08655 [Chromobacterium alticapitis]